MRKLTLKELNRKSVSEFKELQKTPLILVLDNIRSGLNVGSAFRTADAFALEKVVLTGITAKPPHREILKTAIGATDSVEWEYFEHAEEAVLQLRKEGIITIGIEQAEGSINIEDFKIQNDKKYALVFGNEVKGVSQSVMDNIDYCVEVPQYGTKHSLNISVCVGLVSWEFFKKLNPYS